MTRHILMAGGGLILGVFLGIAIGMQLGSTPAPAPRAVASTPSAQPPAAPPPAAAPATQTPAAGLPAKKQPAAPVEAEPRKARFTLFKLDVPWDAKETVWSAALAKQINGTTEFPVEHGRVDVFNKEYAVEVDWIHKWHESIGQALHYAHETNRTPVIALASRTYSLSTEQQEFAFWLDRMLHEHGIKVWFLVVRQDNLGAGTIDVPGARK